MPTQPPSQPVKQSLGLALMFCGVLMAVLPVLYLLNAERIFQATARIQIEPRSTIDAILFKVPRLAEPVRMEADRQHLMSRTLMESVIQQLRLDQDLRYARRIDKVRALLEDITVAPIPNSSLIDIKVTHPNPIRSAAIANTLVTNFLEMVLSRRTAAALDCCRRLQNEIASEAHKLGYAEQELESYRVAMKMPIVQRNECPLQQALVEAVATFLRAKVEMNAAKESCVALETHQKAGKPLADFPILMSDEQVRRARLELLSSERDLTAAKKLHLEGDVEVRQANAKVEANRELFEQVTRQQAKALTNQLELARMAERESAAHVDAIQAQMAEWGKAQAQYRVHQVQVDAARQTYEELLKRTHETEVNSRNQRSDIALVDKAVPPFNPIRPRPVRTLAFVPAGAFLILIGMGMKLSGADLSKFVPPDN